MKFGAIIRLPVLTAFFFIPFWAGLDIFSGEAIFREAFAQERPADPHAGHTGGAPKAGKKPGATATQAGEEGVPAVEISPEQQQLIAIRTTRAALKPLRRAIRTVGRVEYDEKGFATVNTKFEGWIEKLHVDYTGRFVHKGEPLAEIYSPELFATQQEFINVLRWGKERKGDGPWNAMLARDADAILDAARQRLRLFDITDEQIKKIEETGSPIRRLTLYSPVAGFVVQKMAVQGMRAMPGEKLFDLADLSTVWVIADIYEYELPLIRLGQPALISLSYFPGKEFASRIEYVYPVLSSETRTAKVRFTIPNPDGLLKPQMFTNVEVRIDLGKRLVIPDEAVIDTGTRKLVYVQKGEGSFEPREIVTGIRADGEVEILKGLNDGERVASSGNFLIDSEAQLKGVAPGHKH